MSHVRHYRLSCRFNRPAKQVEGHLNERKHLIDIFTGSEFGSKQHHDAFRKVFTDDEFWRIHPDGGMRGENAIAVRKVIDGKATRIDSSGSFKPTDVSYVSPGRGYVKPGYVTWAVICCDGEYVLITCSHMPHGDQVYAGLKNKRSDQVRTYFAWLSGVKKYDMALRKKYNIHKRNVMHVNDWNIDFKKLWTRVITRPLWPSLRITWPYPIGSKNLFHGKGTDGKRVIDATLTGAKVVRMPVVMSDPHDASDHNPYAETLQLW